jgi:hypothetical protein
MEAPSQAFDLAEAESVLTDLAGVFFQSQPRSTDHAQHLAPNFEARYKALLDQIPAVVFMASLDEGIGEAYVSPQIEATLGFSQKEWLEDPVRWYHQVHHLRISLKKRVVGTAAIAGENSPSRQLSGVADPKRRSGKL